MASSDASSQILRDLKWAVQSPSLIKNAVSAAILGDFELSQLEEFFKSQNSRQVGRYFEALIEFWLTKVRKVEMVERGLQVQDGTRTLGELDFVFRDEEGVLTHWETAVKFYLHHEGSFVGPNAKDTLERKYRHLTEQQIQLGKEAMPEIEKSEVFIKGCLYYHPKDKDPDELPEYVSSDHLRGTWVHASELEWLEDDQVYHILEKPHWFTVPFQQEALYGTTIHKELISHFESSDRPVHLMGEDGAPVFVVADEWPSAVQS